MTSRLGATFVAVASVCTLIIILLHMQDLVDKYADFQQYYAAAKMITDGNGSRAYNLAKMADEQHKLFPEGSVVIPFILPQAIAVVSGIGILKAPTALIVWKTMIVGCLIASIIFLKLAFALKYKQTCYLIALLCLSDSCCEALVLNQLAPILLLALSATIYFLQRNMDISAGLFLSLLIMLKPQQIFIFVIYLAGLRRWRPLIVALGIFILFSLIALSEIGPAGFYNYYVLMQSPESIAFMKPVLNPTFRGQLLRLLPAQSHLIFIVSIIIYAIMLMAAYFYGQHTRNQTNAVLKGVLFMIPIGLITSPHLHDYDLLLLIPTLIIISCDVILPFNRLFKLVLVLCGLSFLLPGAAYLHYSPFFFDGQINLWFWELLILNLLLIHKLFTSLKLSISTYATNRMT